jgi:hypothetical protein
MCKLVPLSDMFQQILSKSNILTEQALMVVDFLWHGNGNGNGRNDKHGSHRC